MNPAREPSPENIEAVAAEWLARRDRGMTPAEQDAYLQWLRERPGHGAAIVRLEKAWLALDRLSQWRPAHSPQPNPDLLAPPRRRWLRPTWLALAGVAALLALGMMWWPAFAPENAHHRQAIIHPGPERIALADGSVVELNQGAKIEVQFTPAERRVLLRKGEAHFTVAKNPARPFIVRADQLAVRAVGTAFSVSLAQEAVSVLVTEGKVRLDQNQPAGDGAEMPPHELSHLIAGQQAVIPMRENVAAGTELAVQIRDVTPAEMERALSWQGFRLEFVDLPLGDVVEEFNRYNQRKLLVADPATAAILVAGRFRADNVDTFVRLLDTGFGVKATVRGNEIVLHRAP